MLYITRQLKTLVNMFVFNNFDGEKFVDLEDNEKKDYLSNNLNKIVKYLNNLDSDDNKSLSVYDKTIRKKEESGYFDEDEFDILHTEEINFSNDYKNLVSIMDSVGLNNYDLNDGVDISLIIEKLEEFTGKKAEIYSETKNELKTLEEKTEAEHSVLGLEVDSSSKEELLESVNKVSLLNLLKNSSKEDLGKIISDLESSLGTDPRKYTYTDLAIGDNYSGATKVLRESGYKTSWMDDKEIVGVINGITDVYDTQVKIENASFKDKIAIIFDYNKDSLLDNEVRFYTKEKQFFDEVESEEEFNNLLSNLGYTIDSFESSFSNNYYAAREEFKSRLATILDVDTPLVPDDMLDDKDALLKFNEKKTEIRLKISEIIDIHEKTKNLNDQDKARIKLDAAGVILGSSQGLGVSFDIREATSLILDKAGVGYVNGIPGFVISKNIKLTKDNTFSLDLSAVNFIPLLTSSLELASGEIDYDKTILPDSFDGDAQVVLGGGITNGLQTIGLQFNSLNENTKAGIETAKKDMSVVVDKLFDEISNGKSFEESIYSEEKSNKVIYERISDLYNKNGSEGLKEGILNNYERELYSFVEGEVNFSGVGIGLAFIANYLPIPIITVSGQVHDTKWEATKSYSLENDENKSGKTVESDFEIDIKLLKDIQSYEDGFSFRTRYNKGAKELMTPSNDLDTRWNGLLRLSNGVKALREIKLNDFLSGFSTKSDKMMIVSVFSQYMKKASDYNNGNMSDWETRKTEYIKTDKERRSGFNEVFGFNTDKYAEIYYDKLEKSSDIGKTVDNGLGFDATASKNVEGTTIKGVDIIFSSLNVITADGEALLVPIEEKSDIDEFISNLDNLNLSPEMKLKILAGIKGGDYQLNFYKDPDGFNDRILLKEKVSGSSKKIEIFGHSTDTYNLVGGIVGDARKEKNEKEGGGGTGSKPDNDEPTDPEVPEGPDPEPPVEPPTSGVSGASNPTS